MDGLSFAEFESSSFDQLHSRGFAGAKHCEKLAKDLQEGKGLKELVGTGAVPALSSGTRAPALVAAARAQPSAAPRGGPPQGSLPLNDMGHMPGNSRVEHAWAPSKEANERASNQFALPQSVPPRQSAAASAGTQQGAFLGWKSN
ncbi:unnamed protein product [Prorocentrum cordatum]|uniref:Uncharacterized protein n=1 Tax=Prorocentrum cordatum TaxID=2364126 RepID=A0ABN9W7S0_9DINO|nr:unnamed protein product [Polarella glacialis]